MSPSRTFLSICIAVGFLPKDCSAFTRQNERRGGESGREEGQHTVWDCGAYKRAKDHAAHEERETDIKQQDRQRKQTHAAYLTLIAPYNTHTLRGKSR